MQYSKAEKLIKELLDDPIAFEKKGKANVLLSYYYKGYDLETLRPLLKTENIYVQSAALFVVNEMGIDARELITDIIPLLNGADISLRYYALESVAVCAIGKDAKEFLHVVLTLESNDRILRILAMFLISNVAKSDLYPIQATVNQLQDSDIHMQGLKALLAGDNLDFEFVSDMINNSNPLLRKYGTILAKILFEKFPTLINYCLASEDTDLKEFSEDFIDMITID